MVKFDKLKGLSPEERIKKLKGMEEERKKEIEEAERLINQSQKEIEEKKRKEQDQLIEDVVRHERTKLEEVKRLDEMLHSLHDPVKTEEEQLNTVVETYKGLKELDYHTLTNEEKDKLGQIYESINDLYSQADDLKDVAYATRKVLRGLLKEDNLYFS